MVLAFVAACSLTSPSDNAPESQGSTVDELDVSAQPEDPSDSNEVAQPPFTWAEHPRTDDDIRAQLIDSGLTPERIQEVVDIAEPALILVPEKTVTGDPAPEILARTSDEGDIPGGRTQIGGMALLPPDYPWPALDGKPMVLHAQIDLDAAGGAAGPRLPDRGILQFYSDEYNEAEHGVLLWFDSNEKLEVRQDGYYPFGSAQPLPRNFRQVLSVPNTGERVFSHWSQAERQLYWDAVGETQIIDQLGGWAFEFQNDPVYSVAIAEAGLTWDDIHDDLTVPEDRTDQNMDEYHRSVNAAFGAKTDDEQWRLLLQLATAPGDSMFGDAGIFWMYGQQDLLTEQDFSNIRQTWASH